MGLGQSLEGLPDLGMMAEDGRFKVISGEPANATPAREAIVVHRDGTPPCGIMVCRIHPTICLSG